MIAAFLIVAAAETLDLFYQAGKNRGALARSRQVHAELIRFVKAHIDPGAVVLARDVGNLCWENGNVAIDLALDFKTAERIYREFIPFDTLLVSTTMEHGSIYHYSPEWAELAAGRRTFMAFRPQETTTLSSGEQIVLLRDGARR